jgi:hypothetical protein
MIFTVVCAEFLFCCIECARRNGFEPDRMALPDEGKGLFCTGCNVDLDFEECSCGGDDIDCRLCYYV